ncbi:hypothetical protein CH063_14620 [Colletotrichum higginsianum]|uniref:Uncharacterized protein n=2 Tax=Colletotrichum higginsianum (strain IMI 349063) TaxID=759273 RepID=H1VZB7_COLHI|nr:hypothetical protein CH063_14620 [Colletotrichum higginsianum]
MNSPTCSCQFIQTIRNLNLPYYQQQNQAGFLSLEEIVSLDWRCSKLIQATQHCRCCVTDLDIMIATQSTLEIVLSLLEAAQSAYSSRISRRDGQSSAQAMDELLKRGSKDKNMDTSGDVFVLGRVALDEEDCDAMARSLIMSAILRMATGVRELRERIATYREDSYLQSRSAGQCCTLPRQAKDADNELDSKLSMMLARIRAVVARARM